MDALLSLLPGRVSPLLRGGVEEMTGAEAIVIDWL